MRVPGVKQIQKSARWIRSRFKDRALIIGYHRITDDANDVYGQCISPENFAEHLSILRHRANPITITDLLHYLEIDSLPPRSVVVTLDDGYADNLYQASPLLVKYNIPATLFISTGYLGKKFWWDELAGLILNAPSSTSIDLIIDGEAHTWLIHEQDRVELLKSLYFRLLNMSAADRKQMMSQLRMQIDIKTIDEVNSARALTPEEIIKLEANELITIGAHTVNHPILTRLPQESQRYEIEQSKRDLEEIIQRPVMTFSYPNGVGNEITQALLKDAGFHGACSSSNDIAWTGSNLLHLPRFWPSDQRGNDFARWLNFWI